MAHIITSLSELEDTYGEVNKASLLKEANRLVPEYRALIEASPFAALATRGPEGLDCSPRGDGPGFVRVLDDRRSEEHTSELQSQYLVCRFLLEKKKTNKL